MSRKALIVVDLQNDYFPGGRWALSNVDAAADNAATAIGAARSAGDLVVHVRHESRAADAPFFVAGSKGAQIHEKVLPEPGEDVVVKHHVNAFRETGLEQILKRNGIQAVALAGAMSHMCIDAAARAASDFGYDVTVLHDACATCDLEFHGTVIPAVQVHGAFMSALAFAYAKTVSTDDFLGPAEHPHYFRRRPRRPSPCITPNRIRSSNRAGCATSFVGSDASGQCTRSHRRDQLQGNDDGDVGQGICLVGAPGRLDPRAEMPGKYRIPS